MTRLYKGKAIVGEMPTSYWCAIFGLLTLTSLGILKLVEVVGLIAGVN